MNRFSVRRLLPPATAMLLLAVVGLLLMLRKQPSQLPIVKQSPPPTLSALAEAPEWKNLDAFQNTISREDFERFLTSSFTTGDAWKKFITLTEAEALIQTGGPAPADVFRLRFSTTNKASAPRTWKTPGELPTTTRALPLAGLHIAIDPGHIGGDWAKMEERWFVVGSGKPVCEGDMTLYVAKILKPRLEALGAVVSLVRDKAEPVTSVRPESLLSLTENPSSTESPQKLAERLFYRTAEIHARAKLVNETLKPDLVLCLHFNAEAWGDPNNPTLIDRTHLHLLVNGAYGDEEIALADQRFSLLEKLLQRTQQEEIAIGSSVARSFAAISGLPPYQYPPEANYVRPIPDQPYLWARNLLANRLYDCPVIFMEPYVMNSTLDYARIQEGDFEGTREICGLIKTSIFIEYADALTEGLKNHYSKLRKFSD